MWQLGILQGASRVHDRLADRRVAHDRSLPRARDGIVARDEASAASRQKEDGVEDAPADGNDLPAAAELEALLVRLEAAEPRDHRRHAPLAACATAARSRSVAATDRPAPRRRADLPVASPAPHGAIRGSRAAVVGAQHQPVGNEPLVERARGGWRHPRHRVAGAELSRVVLAPAHHLPRGEQRAGVRPAARGLAPRAERHRGSRERDQRSRHRSPRADMSGARWPFRDPAVRDQLSPQHAIAPSSPSTQMNWNPPAAATALRVAPAAVFPRSIHGKPFPVVDGSFARPPCRVPMPSSQ